MATPKLKLSKNEPPGDYGLVGIYRTRKEADNWYESAIKSKCKNPFWLMHKNLPMGKMYVLYWRQHKNEKIEGKGVI